MMDTYILQLLEFRKRMLIEHDINTDDEEYKEKYIKLLKQHRDEHDKDE